MYDIHGLNYTDEVNSKHIPKLLTTDTAQKTSHFIHACTGDVRNPLPT